MFVSCTCKQSVSNVCGGYSLADNASIAFRYEEWLSFASTCNRYPQESLTWLWDEIRRWRFHLNVNFYPYFTENIVRLNGWPDTRAIPGPLVPPELPDYLRYADYRPIQYGGERPRQIRRELAPGNISLLDRQGFWNGGWPIGEGGQGLINLWVGVDGHQRINDRMVVKDTMIRCWEWERPSAWRGDFRNVQDRIPVEVQAMNDLTNITGSDKFVGVRHW